MDATWVELWLEYGTVIQAGAVLAWTLFGLAAAAATRAGGGPR